MLTDIFSFFGSASEPDAYLLKRQLGRLPVDPLDRLGEPPVCP